MSPDLLSAASLLIGAVGIVYGLWYGEIVAAKELTVRPLRASRDKDIEHVERVIKRATFLTTVNWLLVLIFAPPVLGILWRSVRALFHDPIGSWRDYDAVTAAFVAVYGVGVALGIASFQATLALKRKLAKLRQPDAPP